MERPIQRSDRSASDYRPYFFNIRQTYLDKPLLIYLPGLDETGKGLIDLQTASFESDFNVCSLVIPANNLEDWEALATTALALTRAEIKKLPRPQPVYLCAESFGGCLALEMLAEAPSLFDQAVLVNSASSFHRVPWLVLGARLLPWVPDLFFKLSTYFSLPFLAQVHRLTSAARKALLRSTQSAPKPTLQWRLTLMRTFSIREAQLRQVVRPVLLIGSAQDRILPSVNEALRLAKIFPQSQVVTLPHSGHACLVENGINLDEIMKAHPF